MGNYLKMLFNPFNTCCEICGEPRGKKVHRKCSRILQKRHNAELAKRINDAAKEYELKNSMDISRRIRITGRDKEYYS